MRLHFSFGDSHVVGHPGQLQQEQKLQQQKLQQRKQHRSETVDILKHRDAALVEECNLEKCPLAKDKEKKSERGSK